MNVSLEIPIFRLSLCFQLSITPLLLIPILFATVGYLLWLWAKRIVARFDHISDDHQVKVVLPSGKSWLLRQRSRGGERRSHKDQGSLPFTTPTPPSSTTLNVIFNPIYPLLPLPQPWTRCKSSSHKSSYNQSRISATHPL